MEKVSKRNNSKNIKTKQREEQEINKFDRNRTDSKAKKGKGNSERNIPEA